MINTYTYFKGMLLVLLITLFVGVINIFYSNITNKSEEALNQELLDNKYVSLEENVLAVVLLSLGSTNDTVTKQDLEQLTSLEAYDMEITDLSGLEYAKNLETLILTRNHIEDITPLAGLKKLRELDLAYNQIKNISHLENSKNLEILRLANNDIEDIRVLRELKELRVITLEGNRIHDYVANNFNYYTDLSWSPDGNYLAYRVLNDMPSTLDVHIINVSDNENGDKFYSFAELFSKENPFQQNVLEASPYDLYRSHEWFYNDALYITLGEGSTFGEQDALEAGVYKWSFKSYDFIITNIQ